MSARSACKGGLRSFARLCTVSALAAGMWEMRDQAVLRSVLEVFAKIGVRPIVFKGAALAYSFYPSPVLRTRADADLLILPRDRVKVVNAIEIVGFC